MSDSAYMAVLQEQFCEFNSSNFIVQFMPPRVFVCGGPMLKVGISLRERIFRYAADKNPLLENSLVVAENFKDYFKEGAYANLMQFEDDIANISTLIVICLESAGSLVELGLFSNRKSLAHRLLVFVPSEELDGDPTNDIPPKSSFIYLGPLQSLKKLDESSVLSYPWPKEDVLYYQEIDLVVNDIEEKLKKVKKSEKYSMSNSGHLAILIYEIVLLSEPIKITEIEWALYCMDIDESKSKISRLLYLLEMMKLIGSMPYSGTDYYYAKGEQESKIKFGKTNSGKIKDSPNIKMAIRQSYIKFDEKQMDETAKKRRNVLSRITVFKREGKA